MHTELGSLHAAYNFQQVLLHSHGILYQKQFPDSLTMSVRVREVLAYHWLRQCFNDGNDGLLLDSGFVPGEGTPSTDWHRMEWTKESYGFRAHGGIFSHPFISVTLGCVVSFGFTYVVNVSQWESDRQSHQSLTDHYKSHQSTTDHHKYSDYAIKVFQEKDKSYSNIFTDDVQISLCFASLLPSGFIWQKHPKAHNLYIDSFTHLFSIFLHFAFLHQNLLMRNTNSLSLKAILLFSSKQQEPHQRS